MISGRPFTNAEIKTGLIRVGMSWAAAHEGRQAGE